MTFVLEGKSIGSDQEIVLKGKLLNRKTKNQRLNLLQIIPNWFLGNWTWDLHLKWALVKISSSCSLVGTYSIVISPLFIFFVM